MSNKCLSLRERIVQDVEFFSSYTKLVNLCSALRMAQRDPDVKAMGHTLAQIAYLSSELNMKIHNINSKLLEEVCDGRGKDTIPVA